MFAYHLETPGEQLCRYLFERSIVGEMWDRFEAKHLFITARSQPFRDLFQEALAINMTRRFLLAAETTRKVYDPTDSGFLRHLEGTIDRWGMSTLKGNGSLVRLIRDSTVAGHHQISPTLRKYMLRWTQEKHPRCYMCGASLEFSNKESINFATLDHLWPQSHGGDSVEQNILPACRICNHEKKRDSPSWAALAVHAINIGQTPSSEERRGINGPSRFAIYNFAAKQLANEERLSLKQAYMKLRPWVAEAWLRDDGEVGDFFNIAIHEV